MIGTLVNTLAVICGSVAGLFLKKGIPERITDAVMASIGLCTLMIGILGLSDEANTLVVIFSMVLGTALGTLLDLAGRLAALGSALERRVPSQGGTVSPAQGFVTGSLLFCIGSMTITGSLTAGLTGDCSLIYAKSLLDLISSFILAMSLGIGVLFSAAFVLVFQGALVLLAGVLAPVLTAAAIADMTTVGSLLVLALGLNLLHIADLRTTNLLPAVFLSPLITAVAALLSRLFS